MPTADDFRRELSAQIERAIRQNRPHVEVNAGELHRVVGGYPNEGAHAMPNCCRIMRDECQKGRSEIVFEPEKGQGASLTIRFYLPR